MDVRTILVPIDSSKCSEKAFTWALALAEQWHARMILLHVVPVPAYPPHIRETHFDPAEFETAITDNAEARTKEFVPYAGSGAVSIDTKIILGQPCNDICQVAEQEKADLIVMGSHGRSGVSQVLLDSVAERVVQQASCPVLVVGKKAHAYQGMGAESGQ